MDMCFLSLNPTIDNALKIVFSKKTMRVFSTNQEKK